MTITSKQNRVWIEIERSDDDATNEKRAELFAKMINRLRGDDATANAEVRWYKKKNRYAYTNDAFSTYHTLNDDGEWFNLDFLGR